jgi:hypothetical protein
MAQRCTHRNESEGVTRAKAGVHVREELDSRFGGNDVTFDGASLPPMRFEPHPMLRLSSYRNGTFLNERRALDPVKVFCTSAQTGLTLG